eukprot:1137121-Pelagomonas_calceolata.AAC.1
MAEILYLTNHWAFSLHFLVIIFFWRKDLKSSIITQFGGQIGGFAPRLHLAGCPISGIAEIHTTFWDQH